MIIIHLIAGARPNFMKVAPLYHALKSTDWCKPVVVWIRQHTDSNMSGDFLAEFNIPNEDMIRRPVAVGTPTQRVGLAMLGYEDVLANNPRPDAIVVVGDVDATLACALVGAKLEIPVVHLEAGLRSHDKSMPEEINRIVVDSISDLLLTPDNGSFWRLAYDMQTTRRVVNVGNIMIDTLEMMRPKIEAQGRPILSKYALVTLHRPSNVDNHERLAELIDAVVEVSQTLSVVWPVHPRTEKRLIEFNERAHLDFAKNLHLYPPLDYVKFMALVKNAAVVITDSGGVQEETSYLGVPCLTMRENTERPITISRGTNMLCPPTQIVEAVHAVLDGAWGKGKPIPLWDGHTAGRCVNALKDFLAA